MLPLLDIYGEYAGVGIARRRQDPASLFCVHVPEAPPRFHRLPSMCTPCKLASMLERIRRELGLLSEIHPYDERAEPSETQRLVYAQHINYYIPSVDCAVGLYRWLLTVSVLGRRQQTQNPTCNTAGHSIEQHTHVDHRRKLHLQMEAQDVAIAPTTLRLMEACKACDRDTVRQLLDQTDADFAYQVGLHLLSCKQLWVK